MIFLICNKYNLIAPQCLDHIFALKSATKTAVDQSGRPNENHHIVKGNDIKHSEICFLETHTVVNFCIRIINIIIVI